jgi:hypothetical protein
MVATAGLSVAVFSAVRVLAVREPERLAARDAVCGWADARAFADERGVLVPRAGAAAFLLEGAEERTAFAVVVVRAAAGVRCAFALGCVAA